MRSSRVDKDQNPDIGAWRLVSRHWKTLVLLLWLAAPVAQAATYTVANTNNSGAGSFRQAIDDANSNPGLDTIDFNIPGTGPHVISLTSWLPAFTNQVIIDGYSQPGAGPRAGVGAADSMQDTNEPPARSFYRVEVQLP